MITKTHDIILKLTEPDYINSGIKVVANDYLTNIFNIRIFDDLTEIDYTQIDHATIVFAKPDNTFVQGNLTKAATGYTYIIGTNDTASAGTITASVQLYGNNNERLTTARFQFAVIPNLADKKAIESTSEFTALTRMENHNLIFEFINTQIKSIQKPYILLK